ncbi:hypothetical protein H9P43_007606 [Blastocladiella emersonii ATCC 22665]|nr:hypothetical protein H9P43_007606 [Blastocladiella emersonii ATCC 22665]
MLDKLYVPAIIERILVHAVKLHDKDRAKRHLTPNENGRERVRTLMQYARVMPRALIPGIERAILLHAPLLSLDRATEDGKVAVLAQWAAHGLPLKCSSEALESAITGRMVDVVEWWRNMGGIDDVVPELEDWLLESFGHSDYFTAVRRKPCNAIDHAVDEQYDAIANGLTDKISMTHEPISIHGLQRLNAAMASPSQKLKELRLWGCTIDIPRLTTLRVPESVVKELNLLGTKLGTLEEAATIFASLPPSLTKLYITNCPIYDKAAAALARALPQKLEEFVFYWSKLTALQTAGFLRRLPPTLHTLDLGGAVLGTSGTRLLIKNMPKRLQVLKLRSAEFDDACAGFLARSLPRTLTWLDLPMNKITSVGALLITSKAPLKLTRLSFCENGIPPSAQPAIRAATPATLTDHTF